MIYASYAFYTANSHGSIPEDAYNVIATDATARIAYYTFGRIKQRAPERVKLCQCEVADYLYSVKGVAMGTVQGEDGRVLKAVTVDGYREEYATAAPQTPPQAGELDANVYNICLKWLTRPNNLMYAGVQI